MNENVIENHESLPVTAIPSWSGFIYQGKVAIYHALKILCDDKTCDHAVQLDYFEDFTILKNDGNIISLHQVKAKASGVFSSYRGAFEKLKDHANEKHCSDAFFHVSNEITDKSSETIEFDFAPIKIYIYHDGARRCAVDQIDCKIDEKIKQFFMNHSSSHERSWRIEPPYLKQARTFLCEIVQEHVLKIHARGQQSSGSMRSVAENAKIDFSKLIAILNDDLNHPDNKEKYYLYQIRQDLRRYYEEFLESLIGNAANLEKIASYMAEIESLNEREIVKFIQNITPHRKAKFDTLQDYHDTLPQNEVEDAFFKILKELKKAIFKIENNIYTWEIAGGKIFYPTTIVHGQSNANCICEKIIKNALNTDIGLMFEKDCLITADIDVASILDEVPHLIRSNYGAGIAADDKRIMDWKKVSLVKLDNAKGEIND